jgi:folylpolyglutamate synthase/dihydropteroate synthase
MIFLDRQISNRSCYTPEELQKMTRLPSRCAGSIAEALTLARSYGEPVLICGSLYLAGEVLAHFGLTQKVLDLE